MNLEEHAAAFLGSPLTNHFTSFPGLVPSIVTNISQQSSLVFRFAAMVDVVGLIASVIIIAYVVNEAFDHAKTFYRSPEELEALQASTTIEALMSSLSPSNP